MAVIGQRTFSDGPDQFMNLANEDFVRPLAFGTNWSTLKITAHVAANFEVAGDISGCLFTMGVCSNGVGYGQNPLNYIGGVFGGGATYGFYYYANAGSPYFLQPAICGVTKVGSSATFANANSASNVFPLTPTTAKRAIVCVTIVKGSPNYAAYPSYYDALYDFTSQNFLDVADQPTAAATTTNGQALNVAGYSLAASEVPGPLNCLDIYWNRKQFPLEFYGIAVTRIS